MDKDLYCANCSELLNPARTDCTSCGSGRLRSVRRFTALDMEKRKTDKAERLLKLERLLKEFRAHPVTRDWEGSRLGLLAETCLMVGVNTVDEWLARGAIRRESNA